MVESRAARRVAIIAFVASLACPVVRAENSACGKLENHYGPFDYRTTSKKNLELVESFHFTPKVEKGIGGNTSITAGGDLNYTLRVFPNHHRALAALIRLSELEHR